MDFDEAVAYMSSLVRFGWKLGNDRIEALCARLGSPQHDYAVVHVAGTKGKGSTTALTAAILHASRLSVGAYFSPYVYDVCERIQVNGAPIPRDDFARLVTLVRPHIEALAQTEHGQTTEFELKTVIGFLYFAERRVDVACIEVGIGGRLDATNIVQPAVTVITNIGLDHTEILGDTYSKIAGEKAGIIKPGVPCITAAAHPDASETIREIAAERGSPLTYISRGSVAHPTANPAEVRWNTSGAMEEFAPVTVATAVQIYAELPMRMGGLYQRENAACAVAAAERFIELQGGCLDTTAIRTALAGTALPGRLAIVPLADGPQVILDGAHNALAAEALASAIRAFLENQGTTRMVLVVGMVGGHAPDGVLAALAPMAQCVTACQPRWKRAQEAEAIAAAARRYCGEVRTIPSVREAVEAALEDADSRTIVLITGSFYTVGEVRPEDLSARWDKLLSLRSNQQPTINDQ